MFFMFDFWSEKLYLEQFNDLEVGKTYDVNMKIVYYIYTNNIPSKSLDKFRNFLPSTNVFPKIEFRLYKDCLFPKKMEIFSTSLENLLHSSLLKYCLCKQFLIVCMLIRFTISSSWKQFVFPHYAEQCYFQSGN